MPARDLPSIVDYAHTAESLAKVLGVLRPVTAGRLIAVFGSAGDRDRVKRPEMGAVAARMADFSVITDEDPREEDAASILREIAAGARGGRGLGGTRLRHGRGAAQGHRYGVSPGRGPVTPSCWPEKGTNRASSLAVRSCPGMIARWLVKNWRRSFKRLTDHHRRSRLSWRCVM